MKTERSLLTDTHRPAVENQANPDAPSTARRTSWLAWALAALSVAMFVGGCAFTVLSLSDAPATQPSSDWGTASALGGLVLFLPFLAFPLVGALIASRRSWLRPVRTVRGTEVQDRWV